MKKMILAAALGATMLGGAACAQGSINNDATADSAPAARMHHRGMHGGMGAAALMQADLNHDGVVTRAEAAAAADQRFATSDTNRDGKITGDERRAQRMEHREEKRDRAGAAGGTMPPAADRGAFAGRDQGKGMGMRGNREVSQAQFRDGALKMFDRVDTNHNGAVDANEIAAAKLVMRARMADRRGDAQRPPADASDDQ